MSINSSLSSLWKQEPSLWEEKGIEIRDELGDELDVFALKNLQNNILLYNPSILSTVYNSIYNIIKEEVNHWTESTGLSSFFKEDFSDLSVERRTKILKSLVNEHVNSITKKLGLGVVLLSEVDFDDNKIVVIVDECAEAHEASVIGHSICFNMAAILAGEIGANFSNWCCYEKKCKAKGSNYCEFVIAPQEKINEKFRNFLNLPSRISFTLRGKFTSMISELKEDIDYTPILEESVNRLSYILPNMEGRKRSKLGNVIHIRAFQQYYLSFLTEDFEQGSETLYEAGFNSGKRFSKTLSVIGMRNEDKLKILPRLFDRLGIGLLELNETENGFQAIIDECAFSYGLDLEKKVCYFNSGFFSGIISKIKKEKYGGKETKCSGEGGEYCVHSIEPLN